MRLALGALRRRPARTVATSLGIGMATGLVVLLLALSAGIQSSATRLAAASGIDLIGASANTTLSSGTFPPLTDAHSLPASLALKDPNVATASPWLVGSLSFANASLYAASNASETAGAVPSGWAPSGAGAVGWIPGDNAGLEVPTLYSGDGFSSPSDPHYANGSFSGPLTNELELDQGLALVLHAKVGDLIWVSDRTASGPAELPTWFANATAFRVVGVTTGFWLFPSELLGFFYLSEMQALVGYLPPGHDYATLVLIHLQDASDPGQDQGRLANAFPALSFFTIGNILTAVQDAVELYRTFGTLVGVLGLVVATLFTTTVLLMSVDDRSRELAVFRAIGFRRARIGLLVVEEGLWLAAFGLLAGLGIGWAGAEALNRFLGALVPGLPSGFTFVSFDAGVIGFGIAEVLVVGLIASIAPAARAMTLPVSEELRAP